MKTRLTLLFCTLALIGCHAVPRTLVLDSGERGESVAHAAAHTYRVETPLGMGSGWAWDHDTIITNRHVVGSASAEGLTIEQGDLTWTVIHVERIDGMDVALLDVIGPPLPVPDIRAFGMKVGESVTMSGHPHGNPECITTWGFVAGRWFWRDMIVDGAIIPGMSGGPVFDSDGRVVGMNVATTTPPGRALGIVIDISDIVRGIANDSIDFMEPLVPFAEGEPVG